MKRYIILSLSALALLWGCTQKEAVTLDGDTVELTFRSDYNVKTKLSIDGMSVKWENGDAVNFLDKSRSSKVTVSTISSDRKSAELTATVTAGEQVYAVSPYSSDVTLNGSTISARIPSEQDGTFEGAHIAAAKATGTALHFESIVTMFSFTVNGYPSARYVRIEPINSGEYISGKVNVKYNPDMSVSFASEKSSSVLVSVASGTTYAGIFPGYFKRGFSFSVLDANRSVIKTITCENLFSFSGGQLCGFGELSEHEPSDPPTPTEPFMVETFSKCKGVGGNDGNMSAMGSLITSPNSKTDNVGWEMSGCEEGSGCIIVGTKEGQGYAITPPLATGSKEGKYTLTYRVCTLIGDIAQVSYLEIIGSGAVSTTKVVHEDNKWSTQTVYLTDISDGSRIKFKNYDLSDCRMYIDDVKLTEGCPDFYYLNVYQTEWTVSAETTALEIPCRTNDAGIMIGFYKPSFAYYSYGYIHLTMPENTSTEDVEWAVRAISDKAHENCFIQIVQQGKKD